MLISIFNIKKGPDGYIRYPDNPVILVLCYDRLQFQLRRPAVVINYLPDMSLIEAVLLFNILKADGNILSFKSSVLDLCE